MRWFLLSSFLISANSLTVRVRNSPTSRMQAHTEEVCGLKWSSEGNVLASGGNESFIYIWEASKMSSSNFLHRFNAHNQAAVKALAWCPYQFNVLASGGGTGDGCIKIWNITGGTCTHSIETKAQASYAFRELLIMHQIFNCWPSSRKD